MADHTIEIDVLINNSEQIIQQLREIGSQIDRLSNTRTINIRPNIDMSGLNRFISGLQTAATLTQTIGNGFQGLSNFAGSIGNSFKSMSNLFGTDISKFIAQNIVNSAMSMVRSGMSDAISRYDILSTFTPYMQIAGVNRVTSDAALQRVNQSILGLPIGLDESAYRLRRYQMFVGDTDKATSLTIGLQNALMAGGASESMRNTAYMEMERLLTSGDLSTWRQWQALMTGFGVSTRFLADAVSEITGTVVDPKGLTQGLHEGTIEVNTLLDALELLGRDWSNVSEDQIPKFVKDMNAALEIYKGTIEAWISNIHFAITRGGANMIGTINDVMKAEQGVGITGVMENVRNTINEIFAQGSEFVNAHPEMFQMFFDIVGGFMERAKGFDWELFSTNVMNNMGRLFDMIFTAIDAIPPGYLERFLSFATTVAGPLGTIFEVVRGGLPFMLGVFQRFENFDFNMLIGDITHQIEVFANTVERVLNIVGDERMSKILSFALVWGNPLAKVFGGISRGLLGLASAMRVFGGAGRVLGGEGGLLGGLMSSASMVNEVFPGMLPALGIAAAGVAAFGIAEAYDERKFAEVFASQMDRNPERISKYDNSQHLAELEGILDLGAKKSEWDKAESEVTSKARIAKFIMAKIRSANEDILDHSLSPEEKKKIKEELSTNVSLWNDMFPEMVMQLGENGALSSGSAMFANNMSADFLRLQSAQDYVDAASSARKDAMQQMIQYDTERKLLVEEYKNQQANVRAQSEELKALKARRDALVAQGEGGVALEGLVAQIKGKELDFKESRKQMEDTRAALDELSVSYEQASDFVEQYSIKIDDYMATVNELQNKSFVIEGDIKAWEDLTQAEQDAIAAYESYLEQTREAIHMEGFDRTADKGNVSASQNASNIAWNNVRLEMYYDYLQTLWDWYGSLSPRDQEQAAQLVKKIREEGFEGRDNLYGVVDAIGEARGYIPEAVKPLVSEIVKQITNEENVAQIEAALDADIADATTNSYKLLNDVINGKNQPSPTTSESALRAKQDLDEVKFSSSLDNISKKAEEAEEEIEPLNETIYTTSEHALEAKQSFDEARAGVNNLGSAASSKQGAMSSLSGTFGSVGQAASNAAAMVQALVAAINALHDKEVSIRVAVAGAALGTSLMSGAQSLWNSVSGMMGGLAEGGWAGSGRLLSGPTGTDTIPSWLSPGEFVVNARSAKRFGPTLEAINGMNIDAAFDSLMHNLARPSGMFMPNVTYNRDNHAQVTINNNGETGQGYSQRKAYAWASKL